MWHAHDSPPHGVRRQYRRRCYGRRLHLRHLRHQQYNGVSPPPLDTPVQRADGDTNTGRLHRPAPRPDDVNDVDDGIDGHRLQ